jgi:hypothetical protein
MNTDSTADAPENSTVHETSDAPETSSSGGLDRPITVTYALYAILARCVFALAAGFSVYGARGEITDAVRTTNLDESAKKGVAPWSADTLHSKIDAAFRINLMWTVAVVAAVLMLSWFLREGKNWSRWVYVVLSFIPVGHVTMVAGFFADYPLIMRVTTGLTGVASIGAIVLLFLPASSQFFRPDAGGRGKGMGSGLMAPWTSMLADRMGVRPAGAPSDESSGREGNLVPGPAVGRPKPRFKSRRPSGE